MDSLTQIVLGAAVGEAVLGKKVGNKAMLWGVIGGTIPDLDVFLNMMTDPITAMAWHRTISHSLLFCIVASPIFGWLVYKLYRGKQATWRGWSWLFFGALVTHPLLDAHTTWGTQFLWPFDLRIAYNNIFVVDPLYTIPFLICLLVALFSKRGTIKRRNWNYAGLIVSSLYMILTLAFKWNAHSEFSDHLSHQHIEYSELMTKPTPMNTILWSGTIKTKEGLRIGYYSLLDERDSIQFSVDYPKNLKKAKKFLETNDFKTIERISKGWFFIEEKDGELYFVDARFGQGGVEPNKSPFLWKFKLIEDQNGELRIEQAPRKLDYGKAIGELWERIKGI